MDDNDRDISLKPINIFHINTSENINKAEVQIGRSPDRPKNCIKSQN